MIQAPSESAAAPAKRLSRQEMLQRLGTLERMRKRRAMYPPLSTVFNPDDEIPGLNLPAEGEKAKTPKELDLPITPASGMVLKVVDIDLDDDTQSKEASPSITPITTVAKTTVTTTNTTAVGQNARGSVVAARRARMSRLLSTETNPQTKNTDLRQNSQEKEEPPKEISVNRESPGTQRRNLPKVPQDVEPYVSTPKTTKITSRKQTGKPKKGNKNIIRDVENDKILEEKEARKLAEEMDFVVLDHDDVTGPKEGDILFFSFSNSPLF